MSDAVRGKFPAMQKYGMQQYVGGGPFAYGRNGGDAVGVWSVDQDVAFFTEPWI